MRREVTPAEAQFSQHVVDRAVAEGKVDRFDRSKLERIRNAAVRAYRWQQDKRPQTMAYGAGGRWTDRPEAFAAFDDEFRPQVSQAVGCFGLGIGAFIMSIFWAGIRSWLINLLLRMIWDGTVDLFSGQPAAASKEWAPA